VLGAMDSVAPNGGASAQNSVQVLHAKHATGYGSEQSAPHARLWFSRRLPHGSARSHVARRRALAVCRDAVMLAYF